MSFATLVTLAEMHHRFGLIGISDLKERLQIAAWLADDTDQLPDPRLVEGDEGEPEREDDAGPGAPGVTTRQGTPRGPDDPGYLEFLFMGWVFTKADPDPYPSTPHGHWGDKNRKWPKLDPYRGCVFVKKDQEDRSQRLGKSEMRLLWRDESFKDFCRGHLVWYMEKFPHHAFRVPGDRVLIFPRW